LDCFVERYSKIARFDALKQVLSPSERA